VSHLHQRGVQPVGGHPTGPTPSQGPAEANSVEHHTTDKGSHENDLCEPPGPGGPLEVREVLDRLLRRVCPLPAPRGLLPVSAPVLDLPDGRGRGRLNSGRGEDADGGVSGKRVECGWRHHNGNVVAQSPKVGTRGGGRTGKLPLAGLEGWRGALEAMEARARRERDAAGANLERQRQLIAAEAAEAAEEAWRLALVGYPNGITPMLNVLQAQAALAKTRADEEGAGYDRTTAIVDLYLASGHIVGQNWSAAAEAHPEESAEG